VAYNAPSVLSWFSVGKVKRGEKTVDRSTEVRCFYGIGKIREEVWQNEGGQVLRYNLAFIHHLLWAGDNGRVLGYDNAHGVHHRHYCGQVESIGFVNYETVSRTFFAEVRELREKESL
jgi:hypothetical protein